MTAPKLPDPTTDAQPVIAYRVGQLEEAVKVGFKEHNDKLDSLMNNFASMEGLNALNARVVDLENDRKWLVRLVVGAVVFAILGLVGVGFNTFR